MSTDPTGTKSRLTGRAALPALVALLIVLALALAVAIQLGSAPIVDTKL